MYRISHRLIFIDILFLYFIDVQISLTAAPDVACYVSLSDFYKLNLLCVQDPLCRFKSHIIHLGRSNYNQMKIRNFSYEYLRFYFGNACCYGLINTCFILVRL